MHITWWHRFSAPTGQRGPGRHPYDIDLAVASAPSGALPGFVNECTPAVAGQAVPSTSRCRPSGGLSLLQLWRAEKGQAEEGIPLQCKAPFPAAWMTLHVRYLPVQSESAWSALCMFWILSRRVQLKSRGGPRVQGHSQQGPAEPSNAIWLCRFRMPSRLRHPRPQSRPVRPRTSRRRTSTRPSSSMSRCSSCWSASWRRPAR